MKIYGHPWSINTRKTLLTLEEKGHRAELVLVMIPKGEQRQPEHTARHPFAKVPVLDDEGFVLYETRAINMYLDRRLHGGTPLVPPDDRGLAEVERWIGVGEAYFVPHAAPLIVETLFRRYLGGERNADKIRTGRDGMQQALDVADRRLASSPHLAGDSFTLADIHWMPYVDYLVQIGEGEHVNRREHLARWWDRVSQRETWRRIARTGPQPYDEGMTAEVIEKRYR